MRCIWQACSLINRAAPDAAIELIRRSIALRCDSPEAWSNLGNALSIQGELDEAIAAYRRAIALNPDFFQAHNQLGNALTDAQQLDLAIDAYRQAIAIQPDYHEALYNLGNNLYITGRLEDAVAAFRLAIASNPDYPHGHNNLGVALKSMGHIDDAIAAYRQAIALWPDYPEAFNNLGVAFNDRGRPDEAIAACRQALVLKPDYAEACGNLGNALRSKGELDEAIAAYRQALAIKPDYPEALGNLGVVLREQGRLEEAIAACRQAIARKPDFAEALTNLGNALTDTHRLDEAIAAYRRAIDLKPGYPEAHNNLSNALREDGRADEAIAASRAAISLRPDYAEAYGNIANALKDQGRLDEAVTAYRMAIRHRPGFASAHGNLLYTLYFQSGVDAASIAREHQAWERQHAQPLKRFIEPHRNDRDPTRRLRIGYVSPDFKDHVVGRNLVPLFREHDRRQFEITCYAQVLCPDGMTVEFQRHADRWRSIVGLSDDQTAAMVRADRIDILVDSTLHMAHTACWFGRKPAPIQVTFAGYPGTTGLTTMDYRFSDPSLDPFDEAQGTPARGNDSIYSETTVRLPDSFWCYDPLDCGGIPVNDLPATRAGFVTFGCLNNFCKVNDAMLATWAAVLRQVEGSRLLLLTTPGSHRQRTLDRLLEGGVHPARVEFIANLPRLSYLEQYHRIDIGLDTSPYNGQPQSGQLLDGCAGRHARGFDRSRPGGMVPADKPAANGNWPACTRATHQDRGGTCPGSAATVDAAPHAPAAHATVAADGCPTVYTEH